MNKDSKIYLAGHTGLLGSALLKRLKSEGYSNIVMRTHTELDLTRQESVDEFFKNEQPEYVFLCAGLTGGIIANKTYPATFMHTNIAIQDNVFEAVQKYGVQHLVFYGSSCVYPKNCPQPIKEEYLLTGEIEETSEAYAAAKIAGIIACKSYNNQYKTNRFIVLIPNSMYGPNDNFDLENSHVLSALIRRFYEAKTEGRNRITLWGSGNPRREFMFSDDVADASVFAMKNVERLQNTHYNIGTGIDYSIKELAEIIAKVVGFKGKIEWDTTRPDGIQRKLLDSSRFYSLEWKPFTAIKDGLKITYEWFKNIQKQ
ncbi:MAG: GDP-L-fucose synthase [Candidatus Kuenenia stuttgartiensis]|uniref:GDP-L-fucose synthase n=1 Tax=Kuenenia stuttgartiensis TaxID=174633 RepID=A0A2C9CGV6_KUEST|nr:GDP-L-fucose synthase [Candidatus Kuenenia stuttgartiensis]GJQ51026.1 MAG: GDP-L-fucose synthase [Candidatus Kuenenia stuttgartiensis]SOH04793.1 hypothetical protein KSMBR1_2298 [Candidatus Kuenenia stuttgartiensis]